ncbi:MAG TPA: hypothetical protein VII99_13920 [Bacteroidia bacterium]
MKKKLALIGICLLSGAFCYSQDFDVNPPVPKQEKEKEKEKKPFWSLDKVYVGGGLGLQFGNFTMVNLSPDIGYRITDRYSAGIGVRYIYLSDKRYIPPSELNIYGGSIFNRFIITKFLFAHAEYEILNGPWYSNSVQRSNLNNIWVGGGLRQAAGNSSFNIMALWNLNETPINPFPNPQIRMGISIGL